MKRNPHKAGISKWTREMEDDLVYWLSKGKGFYWIEKQLKMPRPQLQQRYATIMRYKSRNQYSWPKDWRERLNRD